MEGIGNTNHRIGRKIKRRRHRITKKPHNPGKTIRNQFVQHNILGVFLPDCCACSFNYHVFFLSFFLGFMGEYK